MRLEAGGAPVAGKRRALNRATKVRTSLYKNYRISLNIRRGFIQILLLRKEGSSCFRILLNKQE
jgi:hypothetical protein